jgi:NADPH:quinone reductase-like Zn-dependent oxidoreductase
MKAIYFNQAGVAGSVTALGDFDKPVAAPGQVLVKILSSVIHPADFLFIGGKYRFSPRFPQIAGLEGAGIIESKADDVDIPVGKLVAFEARGAWAEYVVVPKESIIILPDDFPIDKAAQFFLNPFTAWGLLEESKLNAGDWLLLTAANSMVSRIVIQLARLRKIKVIAAVRDLKQTKSLIALGADAVIQMEDEQSLSQISKITGNAGVNAALDAVGGTAGTIIFQNMAANGRVIIYGLLSKEPVQFFNAQVIFKNLEIKGFGVRGFLQSQTNEQKKKMVQTLIEEINKESFELPVRGVFNIEQFKEALAAYEQSGAIGKIIFKN